MQKQGIIQDAVQFARSDDFDLHSHLAGLSEGTAERIRAEILARAASTMLKIEAGRRKRSQLRAG